MVVTVAERKSRKIAELSASADRLMNELRIYAALHGGRFLVFGSAARGDLRFDSDIDMMVDFPQTLERDALSYAEAATRRHGLKPDIWLLHEASENLLRRARLDAVILP